MPESSVREGLETQGTQRRDERRDHVTPESDRRGAHGSRLRAQLDRLQASAETQEVVRTPDTLPALAPAARQLGAFHARRAAQVLALDILATLLLFWLASAVAAPALGDPPVGLDHPLPYLFAAIVAGAASLNGGLEVRSRLPGAQLSRCGRLAALAAMTAWAIALLGALLFDVVPLGQLLLVSLLLPLLALANRIIVGRVGQVRAERVLILGTGRVGRRAAELLRRDESCYEVVGFVDDAPRPEHRDLVLGGFDQLQTLLVEHRIDRLVVAFSDRPDEEIMDLIRACDELAVDVDIVPRLFEFTGLEPAVSAVGDLPLVHVRAERNRIVHRGAKRAFDLTIALLLLLVLSPLLIAVAIAIWREDRGPILYRQRRVGRMGRPFDILKFRSMVTNAEKLDAEWRTKVATGQLDIAQAVAAIKHERDPRVTRVGEFIRRTSIDELPQLWNVVRGEMSLVGPRPLRPFEVEALDAWQLVRQRVRPGLTGLWQVLGRSEIDWNERMTLDYAYVRHWSPVTDLRILAETVPVVMRAEGAR